MFRNNYQCRFSLVKGKNGTKARPSRFRDGTLAVPEKHFGMLPHLILVFFRPLRDPEVASSSPGGATSRSSGHAPRVQFYNWSLCAPAKKEKRPYGRLFWQGHKGSNSGHAVLETAALPTELYPFMMINTVPTELYPYIDFDILAQIKMIFKTF